MLDDRADVARLLDLVRQEARGHRASISKGCLPNSLMEFLPRCTCSWRGERVADEGEARAAIATHLVDEANPDVGPNCVPWIEALDA